MNQPALFYFGDIVVVDGEDIGCIVKTWESDPGKYSYEVYVRCYNIIREYKEADIQRYIVSKIISEEEKQWHR